MKLAAALPLFLLAACASREPPAAPPPVALPDFTGAWEKNYGASDDFDSRFSLYLFDVRRALSPSRNSTLDAPYGGGYTASMDAVVGLARFAEELSRTALLDIEQNDEGIHVARDDSFALSCTWLRERLARDATPYGRETCGWNGDRLVFLIDLDALSIRHQLSLSPDRSQLNLTTTVQSAAVSSPFTLSNFYDRLVRPAEDYECVLTLSRNNVCTRRR